jgi:palmitoyltransferase
MLSTWASRRLCIGLPMVALVAGLVCLSYYPYVIENEYDSFASYFSVLVFHVLLVLMVASYVQTVRVDPGTTPLSWHLEVVASKNAEDFAFCSRSKMYKPPRAHYCSVTRRQVLNMDHFCPWVVNTVGFFNRKFFVLFVCYTCAICNYVVITALLSCSQRHTTVALMQGLFASKTTFTQACDVSYLMFTAMVMDLVLGAALIGLGAMHVLMVLKNDTTIEGGRNPHFNVGWRRNVEQVCGARPWLWLIPVQGGGPVGDGINWPTAEGRSYSRLRADNELRGMEAYL